MAPLTKRARIHDPDDPFLPEEILDNMIMPRLPFKTLQRFQCISKKYRSLIGHDILFATEQAKLLSPSPSVLMQFCNNALSFPTNPKLIGLPDPSLKFLSHFLSNRLLCSTNGLILISSCDYRPGGVHLCNPATQESVFVPAPRRPYAVNVGLAFDPAISPNRYKLVKPSYKFTIDHAIYCQFDVFRSDTGEWSLSKEKVCVTYPAAPSYKTVHTKGVIYWYFGELILWYNTEKDLAGSVEIPSGPWSVNVWAGWVVCCRSTDSGLEVWRLTNGTQFDRLHFFSWDHIRLPLDLYHMRRSCVEDVKESDCKPPSNPQNWLQFCLPLAFDGQFVYLASSNGILWGYNTCTHQLDKKGMMIIENSVQQEIFDYHNSLAPIPKILQ